MINAINSTVAALTAHSSVRNFTHEPVSEAMRQAILDAARAASSSCFLQVCTIIRITDPDKREAFARLSGNQRHIVSAPEFWVFCADYHRDERMIGQADLGWTEQLLVACTDCAIMAQSAFAALESLGLGGVYAGGIRNGIEEADRLLELPRNVFPVLGLAFGHPASRNELNPSCSARTPIRSRMRRRSRPMTGRCPATTRAAARTRGRRAGETASPGSSRASAAPSSSNS